MLFHNKKRKSIMNLDMDDVDVMSMVKFVAAGALLYQTAKFVINQMMND